jgi:outer membrane immunogenic protein
MQKILLGSIAAVVFLVGLAVAATAQPVAAPYSWSGVYIGVNGGALSFETNGNFPNHPNNPPFRWHTDRKDVAFAGFHGGVQNQWGNFVVGFEGGFDWILNSGFAQSPGLNGATNPCGYGTGVFCQARIRTIFTFGPRLGYVVNQFMLYGTGGPAVYQLHTRGLGFPVPGAVFESVTDIHGGWFAGAGGEMMIARNVTLGVEYKHLEFGPADNQPRDIPIDTQRVKTKVDAVFLRLNLLINRLPLP